MNSSKPLDGGAKLPIAIAIGIVVICGHIYWNANGSTEAVRSIIRLTARTSLGLFLLAFTASELERLFPSGVTRWISGNRRGIAIGFVSSHAVHLIAVATFYHQAPDLFASVSPPLLIVLRALGVAFIVLMSVSFFNPGMMRNSRWRLILTVGSYYIWGAFLSGFGKRIMIGPFYAAAVVILLMALMLKLAGAWKKRSDFSKLSAAERMSR